MQNDVRLFFTAWTALEALGFDPNGRIILLSNDPYTFARNTLLVTKSIFTTSELEELAKICANGLVRITYISPDLLTKTPAALDVLSPKPRTRDILDRFVKLPGDRRQAFYGMFPFKVAPTTDDLPFFQDSRYFLRKLDEIPELVYEDMEELSKSSAYRSLPQIPVGSIPSLLVILEAGVIGGFTLIGPLRRHRCTGVTQGWQQLSLLYFASLGLAFIWIELVLIKSATLILGSPVYSISVVLSTILISAGIGSHLSERLPRNISKQLLFLALLISLVLPIAFYLEKWLSMLIMTSALSWRITGVGVALVPMGLVLGLPFPCGLRWLADHSPSSIPWAWAANGLTTVLGVSTASLLAPKFGFLQLAAGALVVYLLGIATFYWSTRIRSRASSSKSLQLVVVDS